MHKQITSRQRLTNHVKTAALRNIIDFESYSSTLTGRLFKLKALDAKYKNVINKKNCSYGDGIDAYEKWLCIQDILKELTDGTNY